MVGTLLERWVCGREKHDNRRFYSCCEFKHYGGFWLRYFQVPSSYCLPGEMQDQNGGL